MTARDVYPVQSFYATARTAAADGDAYVDMKGYEEAVIIISSETITDGTAWVFELKECATATGTYTAVAAADLVAGGPTAGDKEPTFALITEDNDDHWFGYIGNKRYLRIDLTSVTGSPGTGGIFSGIIVRTKPHHAPTV
jgi:hypothetical protein